MIAQSKSLKPVDQYLQRAEIQTSHPPERRREVKIPLEFEQHLELRSAFVRAGIRARRTFSGREVNSIYLEDPLYASYSDHVAGFSSRTKRRFRWYNGRLEFPAYEVKNKTAHYSEKEIAHLNNHDLIYPLSHNDVNNIFEINSETVANCSIGALAPVIEVAFHREYYEVAPQIRMTLDTGITYRKLSPIASEYWITSPVYAVLEFKFPLDRSVDATRHIQDLPFRTFRHSKYVIGVGLLYS